MGGEVVSTARVRSGWCVGAHTCAVLACAGGALVAPVAVGGPRAPLVFVFQEVCLCSCCVGGPEEGHGCVCVGSSWQPVEHCPACWCCVRPGVRCAVVYGVRCVVCGVRCAVCGAACGVRRCAVCGVRRAAVCGMLPSACCGAHGVPLVAPPPTPARRAEAVTRRGALDTVEEAGVEGDGPSGDGGAGGGPRAGDADMRAVSTLAALRALGTLARAKVGSACAWVCMWE